MIPCKFGLYLTPLPPLSHSFALTKPYVVVSKKDQPHTPSLRDIIIE